MTEINEQEQSSEPIEIIDEVEESRGTEEVTLEASLDHSKPENVEENQQDTQEEAFISEASEDFDTDESSQPVSELSEPSDSEEEDPFEDEEDDLTEDVEFNDISDAEDSFDEDGKDFLDDIEEDSDEFDDFFDDEDEEDDEEEILSAPKEPKQNLKKSLKQDLDPEEVAPMAREWLVELFEKMAIPNAQIEVKTNPKERKFTFYLHANLAVTPQLSAIMSTPKMTSHTINSIQTILHTYIDRLIGGNVTVEFDINDYFKSRTSKFEAIAQDLADLSTSLKRSLTIAGLSSFDRRVIHNALSNTKEVSTSSIGQGSFRKLCIEPKRTK